MTTQPDIQPLRRKRSFLAKVFQGTFILILLAAVAGCDFYAAQAWQHLHAARSWPRTTGVMRGFHTHRSGWNRDVIQYAVDVTYRYTVNSATFAATNQLPGVFPSAFAADKTVEALRARGSYLPVFYNPRNPADCLLSQEYPTSELMCFGILAIASVLAVAWFGRRLVRLSMGREDFVLVRPVPASSDDVPATPTGLWQRILRWFFALLGAASCWWMAVTIYRDWSLPASQRTLPSAELILLMEFILAHSGALVPGLLSAPSQTRRSKIEGMLLMGLVYLTFATSIAAAAHSLRLFLTFSGIMISRWVGLMLDSDKARQRQMIRSMETFLILFLSLVVCLLLLKLPLEVTLIVYFCLIGVFEASLPVRKRSLLPLQGVQRA